jgi:eukaryotic-like serine/threonine-protein kinase
MYPAGTLLAGKYRLEQRIGAGGMGEVWRATDEKLDRPVAVKVMQPGLLADPEFVQRFRVEARAMAKVRHPNVVAVYDFDDDAAGAYLVMEYVAGESLLDLLRREGRLSPQRTMELIAQAADALQAAHQLGIVHRDVKPANLLVRPDGTVVLTDFGIARMLEGTQLTATGMLLGTLSYVAPEQVLGMPVTARSVSTGSCVYIHPPNIM